MRAHQRYEFMDSDRSLAQERLHEAANHLGPGQEFRDRFNQCAHPHLRRPALVNRLRDHEFPLPEA